jgi:tryptophanyl-tRNA synthetase
MSKKRIFSGIQPSGNLHIGNYLGAIKNWVKLQDEFESIFCVVDLHAITVPQDPSELKKRTIEVAKAYLASGIDPEKSSIFIQSHVQEHTELTWILNTVAKVSELERMTQFKDKTGIVDTKNIENELSERIKRFDRSNPGIIERITNIYKNKETFNEEDFTKLMKNYGDLSGIAARFLMLELEKKKEEKSSMGLFDYPVLMAADILMYDTQKVPVGEDQVQHVELTRTLGKRFNQRFGETFVIPEPYLTKEGTRIMGLDDPTKKMSKSAASEYNYIAMTDDADTIKKKIKKAVTDSGSEIEYVDDPSNAEASKPALRNLINIYSVFTDKDPKEIEKMYEGKGYADFKNDLAEVIVNRLKPIQEKMKELSDEKVLEILRQGAEKVRPLAEKKMKEVKEKIGFIL